MNGPLHALEVRFEHLPSGSLQYFLCLAGVLLVQRSSCQKFSGFGCEHVAVVVDQVVFLRSVFMRQFIQILLEEFLGDFGLADDFLIDGFAVGSGFGCHLADSSPKEVLHAVDNDGGVVDSVDLLADDHHAHALGHAHGDVVDEEGNFFGHNLKNNQMGCIYILGVT